MKIFIVLQGPSTFYQSVKDAYNKLDIIWSIWDCDAAKFIDEKHVVVNKKPFIAGKANFFLQQKSSYNGILMAKKLGATHVMKLRSDMIFSDIELLIEKMMVDENAIYFPGWHDFKGGYFMDFFQFGPIDKMITLWNIKPCPIDFLHSYKILSKILTISLNSERVPEKILTSSYFKYFKNQKVKYILPILRDYNIQCKWLKYGTNFDKFIYDKYCNIKIHTLDNEKL